MAEKLVHYTCQVCGESLELSQDKLSAKCKFCGTEYYFKEENSKALILALNRANLDRLRCDFSDAIKGYKTILTEYPTNAEAHWGLVLSIFGMEYVKDYRTGQYVPTCHRVVEESILNHQNYILAKQNATQEQQAIFERNAKVIDRLQKAIKRKMEDEEEFEVFISFKSKDEQGLPTQDGVIGRKIRDELDARGIKTFFSDVTLQDRIGEEYEPIIYKALNTCKAFILVATSKENINAVWVKNEWTRFEERIEKEHLSNGTYFAVFENLKGNDLPDFLKAQQGFDIKQDPMGYYIRVADFISLKLGKTQKEDKSALLQKQLAQMQEQMKSMSTTQAPNSNLGGANVNSLLERAFLFLEDKNFTEANTYAERVLDIDPKNGEAYLVKLLVEYKLAKRQSLAKLKNTFSSSENYKKILRFGSSTLKQELANYLTLIEEKIVLAQKEQTYNNAQNLIKQNTTESLNKAISLLNTILNFKDSAEQLEFCNKKIEEINLKEQEDLYNKATTLYKQNTIEGYKQATIIFKNLNGFKDSNEQLEFCSQQLDIQNKRIQELQQENYNHAVELSQTEDINKIKEAIKIFTGLKAFKDSKKQIELCNKRIEEIQINNQKAKKKSLLIIVISAVVAFIIALSSTLLIIANFPSPTVNGLKLQKIDGGYAVVGVTSETQTQTKIVVPNKYNNKPIVSIGNSAFVNCANLKEIELSNNLKRIDYGAFYGCANLTSVTMGSSVTSIGNYAFDGCANLTSVTIGENVTSIGNGAFYKCTSLTSIEIPNSVTSIVGHDVFYDCPIETATMPTNAISYIPKTKLKNVIINGGTSIGSTAFWHCDSLTSVTIGNSVTSIESSAFSYCGNLISVTIGSAVTSIGEYAFYNCSKLVEVCNKSNLNITKSSSNYGYIGQYALNLYTPTSGVSKLSTDSNGYIIYTDGTEKILVGYIGTATYLTLPTDITQINKYAFYNNDKITSVTIPNSVTSIGEWAFERCYRLVEVYNKSSINVTKGSLNNGCVGCYALNVYTPTSGESKVSTDSNGYIIYTEGTVKILVGYTGSATDLTLPTEITQINENAFYSYDSLTSVTIGNSVTNIGDYAFSYCDSLTSVTIGNSVTSIGSSAFEYCTSLTSVTIGESVTSIGGYAFWDCDSLTSVTFENPNGWYVSNIPTATSRTNISSTNLSDTSTAARYLRADYSNYNWKRNV